jgi:dihydrofolate synthase/folylpolyglutamate synthase
MSTAETARSSYQATHDFLLGRINYERQLSVPYREEHFRLDRMRELLARLGSPEAAQSIVHIAGTKGKGSTATMVAAILTAAGLRTGLYTSPHLDRVEERFAIDGAICSADDFAQVGERVRLVVETMDAEAAAAGSRGPTYFEVTTAMALLHFALRGVHATVLEVGLGGRLDSTNVCRPLVSVITSISYDHMELLGETLAEIAAEKAGIIKPGVPVISGVDGVRRPSDCDQRSARDVIRRIAAERGSRLVEVGREVLFDYLPAAHVEQSAFTPHVNVEHRGYEPAQQWRDLELGMLGRHQGANAALAIAAVVELRRLGWQIPDEAIRHGLATARSAARVEVIARRPTVIVDAAHNAAAVDALLATLDESFTVRRRTLVFATTKQKDYRAMLARLLPHFDRILLTRYLTNPRSIAEEDLAAAAGELGAYPVEVFASPADAWQALHGTAADELVCITGSFFIAAEMRELPIVAPLASQTAE